MCRCSGNTVLLLLRGGWDQPAAPRIKCGPEGTMGSLLALKHSTHTMCVLTAQRTHYVCSHSTVHSLLCVLTVQCTHYVCSHSAVYTVLCVLTAQRTHCWHLLIPHIFPFVSYDHLPFVFQASRSSRKESERG